MLESTSRTTGIVAFVHSVLYLQSSVSAWYGVGTQCIFITQMNGNFLHIPFLLSLISIEVQSSVEIRISTPTHSYLKDEDISISISDFFWAPD